MKKKVIILTAALLLAMSLSAHAQWGGILDRAIDAVTGGNQPQQTQQPTNAPTPSQSTEPTLNKLNYTQINGQWRITAANKSISGDVIIPSTWNDRNVMYVAPAGFEDCTGITSVTFPATITNAGVGARLRS